MPIRNIRIGLLLMEEKQEPEKTKGGCCDELLEQFKRARADYLNLEKRVASEKEVIVSFANEVLIARLLPVLDGLEKACGDVKSEGLNLVLNEFKKVLIEAGVSEIEAKDKVFDPNFHEAVEVVEGEEGKVVDVVRKGYVLRGKVVRVVRVRVGKKI